MVTYNELTVWLTRPQHQGQSISKLLSDGGYSFVHQPAIEIDAVPADSKQAMQVNQLMLQLDSFKHLIFISTNAVSHGMEHIENYWPQLPIGQHWYAIGTATAKALLRFGVTAKTPVGEQNSEQLLALPELVSAEGEKVIIFSGVGGRQLLADELCQRGADVSIARCYTRDLPTQHSIHWREALQSEKINVIIAASTETAKNSLVMAAEQGVEINSIPIIVPGARAVAVTAELGFKRVIKADDASDNAMMKALASVAKQP
jgi:uroporphyrinogen-III synthase|tara:strand:- start:2826 stop:3605 length:780 start_codon:yes stop_codon:yes gene_type:complete